MQIVAKARTRWTDWQLRRGAIDKNTYYDRLTELVMARVLRRDSVCIDVGAHLGSIVRLMMKYAPAGTFLAFEPIPHMYEQLVAAFAGRNVRVYDVALSDSTGTSSFNYVVSNPAYSGLRRRRYDRPSEIDEQIQVRTDTLDAILAREPVGRVSFVKIDVEGAEYLVFKGALETLRADRPVIVFEHGPGGSDHYGIGPEEVMRVLRDCGLRVSLISDWLLGRRALEQAEFCDQFHRGRNYYFIAHE